MQVPARLQELTDQLREEFGARDMYVVDITADASGTTAGTLIFGLREPAVPPLAAQVRAATLLQQVVQQPVSVEVFAEAETEVEYLFDRYLRPYIASHDGIVTIETIDEPNKTLLIHMDGGCSGCPSSIATLKHGIERTLKKHLPWIERVEASNPTEEPDFNIKLDFSDLASK